jgi:hypothetical protein
MIPYIYIDEITPPSSERDCSSAKAVMQLCLLSAA